MHLSRTGLARASGYGLVAGLAALILIGVPTAVIPSPWFGREIPPRPLDYLFLALTVPLVAALGATYALPDPEGSRRWVVARLRVPAAGE